jgi:hypothetical protein
MGYKVIADRYQMDEMRENTAHAKALRARSTSLAVCCITIPAKVSIMTPRRIFIWNRQKWTRSINA